MTSEGLMQALVVFILGLVVLAAGVQMLSRAKKVTMRSAVIPSDYQELGRMKKLVDNCGETGWGADLIRGKLLSGKVECDTTCKANFAEHYREIPRAVNGLKFIEKKSRFCSSSGCPATRRCAEAMELASIGSTSTYKDKLKGYAEACAQVCAWSMQRYEVCASQMAEVYAKGSGFSSPCADREAELP
ncbi:MAG: hypothetical protein QF415_06860 [Candidatus Undinarchaeales archaeon]|jgi:hypothetical protein|nr:hypothetical protein [Candidatus Undinarchaeales archaeon]MDP7491723.1 hypothetical protein [Candidatus Undinarchaeales archaeon]